MKDGKDYRQYAADCIRMAKTMNAEDRKILLEIAAAWEQRAEEAERKEAARKDGKDDGDKTSRA